MLDSLSPPRRRFVLSSLAIVVAAIVVVVVRAIADDPAVAQDELGPVLLVPGYGGNVVALEPLAEALRSQDRQVVTVRPPGNGTEDLRKQAEHLGDVARQVLERTKAPSVDVVGFSAGGVVARLWVRDGDGKQLARRVLTIGSPHHGTDAAAVEAEMAGNCSRACDQLVPDSDLLRELNAGDETPDGPLWISIASTADQTVTHTRTSGLDGALNLLVQDVCPDNAPVHGALPHDPVVLAVLTTALGRGKPLAPRDVIC